MEEKTIFEYRADHEDDGYHYVLSHGDRRIEIKSTVPLAGFASKRHHARWAKRFHLMGHHKGRSPRAVRKTLDTIEGMYRDIYGNESSDPEIVNSRS